MGFAIASGTAGGTVQLVESEPGTDVVSGATATSEAIGISEINYTGLGVVRKDGQTTYLLENESHQINVTVVPEESTNHIQLCFQVQTADDEVCSTQQRVSDVPVYTEQLILDEWPSNETGEMNVTFTAIADPATDEEVIERENATVHVLAPDEDLSESGLTNAEELEHGTDFLSSDTDRDGLDDGEEVNTYGTDPLSRDTAGNGVLDGTEVLLGTDPTNPWTPHSFLILPAVVFGIGFAMVTLRLTRGDGRPTDESVMPGTRPANAPIGDAEAGERAEGKVPSEILNGPIRTDEDRILELLEESGGQTRQKDIVRETTWSKSKVSRVLSRMEEEDVISRVRLGRENVVMYTDHELSEELAHDESN